MEGTRESLQKMKRRMKTQRIKHIPEDIIDDILVNLPVKCLLRFKCVSKPWRSMISSEPFTKAHLKKSSDLIHHNLIYSSYIDGKSNHTLRSCSLKSFLDEQNHGNYPMVTTWCHDSLMPNPVCLKDIVGSCNGLILISSQINFHYSDLILWNPSTRQVKIIPPSPFAPREDDVLTHSFLHGFGYDDSTDDYKVVSIFKSEPGPYKTHMYSLRTNSWKKIRDFENVFKRLCSGTHVNGKLHWLANEGGLCGKEIIVSINLVDVKYDTVAMPPRFSIYDMTHILHDMGGYLSLVSNDRKWLVKAWVLMKSGEVKSWTHIWTGFYYFTEPMGPINREDPRLPIWLTKNEDVVVFVEGLRVFFHNKMSSRVNAVGIEISQHKIVQHNIYVESLVSPYQKHGQ